MVKKRTSIASGARCEVSGRRRASARGGQVSISLPTIASSCFTAIASLRPSREMRLAPPQVFHD
jgi:hypothetical protein